MVIMRELYEEDFTKALACFVIADRNSAGRPRWMHIWDGDRGPWGFRRPDIQRRIRELGVLSFGEQELRGDGPTRFQKRLGFPSWLRPDGVLLDVAGRPWVAEAKIKPLASERDCKRIVHQAILYAAGLRGPFTGLRDEHARYHFLNVLGLTNWVMMLYGHGSTPKPARPWDGLARKHAWHFGLPAAAPLAESAFEASPGVLLLLPTAQESDAEAHLRSWLHRVRDLDLEQYLAVIPSLGGSKTLAKRVQRARSVLSAEWVSIRQTRFQLCRFDVEALRRVLQPSVELVLDARTAAQEMLRLICQAPMGDRVRGIFVEMAERGDPEAILRQLTVYVERRGDFGASVERAGRMSFESVYPQVQAIYEDWRRARLQSHAQNS